jgi:signal transduction histidine kinase
LLEAFANKLPEEFSSQLHNYVSRQKVALDTLSEIVRHLADEDVFSEPEVLELETVLSSFVCKNEKYSIVYVPDSLAINEAVGKGKAKVYIGKSDLLRLINNIIGNAVEHGFVENKTNYELLITLSTEGDSYLIDFTNNGKPLPEGMDKARYGMKGVKGKDSEGQGTGGYVVKSIVEHYGGDYDIIKREWAGRILTDVIIKLPIYRGDE